MGENFTDDIFIDIFSRLPAKSLMRFKCVGKRWRSLISGLISDRSFVKSHLQRLKAGDLIHSQRIVVGIGYGPLETVDYEALDRGCENRVVVVPHSINPLWKHRVVGSCDGLVCLLVREAYLIYNPNIREYREVPGSDFVGDIASFGGFGYESQSDDYKIVEVVVDGDICEVAIFSLKSGS
ncbi:Pre-mRNA-processing factor 19 [Psidium guajava]|nr:Pre-mRNA-processing factor 19 [Psidium guajava]